MPCPGSHNWRQLGVLGMGHGVRNPCLGFSGSQMGPLSYKIAVYVQTLLESCSIKGMLWDCWETTAFFSPAHSYMLHFQKSGLEHGAFVYNCSKFTQFRDWNLAQMTLPMTVSSWQFCPVRAGQNSGAWTLNTHLNLCHFKHLHFRKRVS